LVNFGTQREAIQKVKNCLSISNHYKKKFETYKESMLLPQFNNYIFFLHQIFGLSSVIIDANLEQDLWHGTNVLLVTDQVTILR